MTVSGAPATTPGWYPDPTGQAAMRLWDGRAWTGQTTNRLPRPLGPGFAKLGDALSLLMRIEVVVCLAALGAQAWTLLLEQRMTSGDAGISADTIGTADLLTRLGDGAAVLGTLVVGVVWLVWQHRLAASAPARLRRGAGMHVASWFIPFLNLRMPVRNVSDLWRVYGAGQDQTPEQASTLLIPCWWAAWLGQGLLAGFALRLALRTTPTLEQLRTSALLDTLSDALMVTAAVLAVLVVQRLSWRALVFWASVA